VPDSSNYLALAGVIACVVGVVGYVALGWRFGDGSSSPVAVAIALVAVALAIGSTVQDRL
jgi:uncharacterized membrane-anchored protein